jgi:preprotein translocase subunit SecE
MARQTRGQRRARRQQQEAGGEASVSKRARARQQQLRPAAQPVKQQTGRRERAPRGKFVRESWGELKKVDWPGRRQVLTGSIVVIIACAIVGAYLYVIDLGFKELVQNVILRSG